MGEGHPSGWKEHTRCSVEIVVYTCANGVMDMKWKEQHEHLPAHKGELLDS